MGCNITKEQIELDMLMLKLKRTEIKDQRIKELELFKKKTGKTLRREKIPDYIDHKAMKVNKVNKKNKKLQSLASDASLKVNYSTKMTSANDDGLLHTQFMHGSIEEEVVVLREIPSLVEMES